MLNKLYPMPQSQCDPSQKKEYDGHAAGDSYSLTMQATCESTATASPKLATPSSPWVAKRQIFCLIKQTTCLQLQLASNNLINSMVQMFTEVFLVEYAYLAGVQQRNSLWYK